MYSITLTQEQHTQERELGIKLAAASVVGGYNEKIFLFPGIRWPNVQENNFTPEPMPSTIKHQYENAFQFLACYFNQDFSYEFEDSRAAVRKFVEESLPASRKAVLSELRQIDAQFTGQALENALHQLGCDYLPTKHTGMATEIWLREVISQIEDSVEGAT